MQCAFLLLLLRSFARVFMAIPLLLASLSAAAEAAGAHDKTSISLRDNRWRINGTTTYPGAKAEGLLMNVRMVNSIFEDLKKPEFDPETNTTAFIAQIPAYRDRGVSAFTICLQGGMPGYEGAVNSAYRSDGSLDPRYLARALRVIEACDRLGMAVIVGCYYQRQDQILQNEEAVRRGVVDTVRWLQKSGFRNVLLEIANEFPHSGFDHKILRSPQGEADLIRLAKQTWPDLLVSTSGIGDGLLPDEVAKASDFLLIHFNGVPVRDIPKKIEALRHYRKAIVCNEDDKTGITGAQAAEVSVANGISWGLMLSEINQYFPLEFRGPADDPIIYDTLRKLTRP